MKLLHARHKTFYIEISNKMRIKKNHIFWNDLNPM